MHRPGWYLVAYDIADPRRLRRVHRALRAVAIPVQCSVFLVHGTLKDIERLLEQLDLLIEPRQDDVRAYPVDAPDTLWLSGPRLLHGGLLHAGDAALAPAAESLAGGWRRLLAHGSTSQIIPAANTGGRP